MEKNLRIDPDDFDDWEEGQVRSGGGGGGGGRKKKEMHQGVETQEAIRKSLIQASKINVLEKDKKHPEVSEITDSDIDTTIKRLVEKDSDIVGLPSFQAYIHWVYRRLNSEVKPETESECILTFERVGGPGGQNVNKVATAVRLEHKYTGVVLEEKKQRYQERNRSRAAERMEELVDEHLEKWMNLIMSKNGEMRKIIAQKLRESFRSQFTDETVDVSKKEAFDKFCSMIARDPVS